MLLNNTQKKYLLTTFYFIGSCFAGQSKPGSMAGPEKPGQAFTVFSNKLGPAFSKGDSSDSDSDSDSSLSKDRKPKAGTVGESLSSCHGLSEPAHRSNSEQDSIVVQLYKALKSFLTPFSHLTDGFDEIFLSLCLLTLALLSGVVQALLFCMFTVLDEIFEGKLSIEMVF